MITDETFLLYTGGIEQNCLNNILDINNYNNENNELPMIIMLISILTLNNFIK